MPEKLWMKVPNIIKEVVTKTIPKKRKGKKEKWLSEDALQIAEQREEKRKGKIYSTECRVPENRKER